MAAFGVMIRILQYAGLYFQLNAALNVEQGEVDNGISGNALFTEVPHDITTKSGEDVEMACSFRGAGAPSYALEIQWWYIKDNRGRQGKPARITNNDAPLEENSKDASKISVVKVAGSNISHKLRLSSVKPSDEGTYECRVIDFSVTVAQQHRVRAHLQVEPERSPGREGSALQEPGQRSQGSHPHARHQAEEGTRRPDCKEGCVL
ncbi:V-set and transmembrane domain-containing protein 2-like protein [Pungitius pungitius]|uniref:V-set and transmembrane domain-containing protein 2-like protein n=1 Tax=Pungitius pungitius TaxID=134920 RepID=UPI001886AFCC|nr:V-set and transmembrane domain-containing protein 2-like protein [Pungitius pungitius]